MAGIMNGVRVLEVAAWTFVPMAGGVLAEWGADVLKIEHPEGGDPQRGLISSGLDPGVGRQLRHRTSQPGQAQRRHRPQHRGGARAAAEAGRDVRRVPHQLPARRPPPAPHRRRRHPRRESQHHLRTRLGSWPARAGGRKGRLRRLHVLGARRLDGHRHAPRRGLPHQPTGRRVRRHHGRRHHRRGHRRRALPPRAHRRGRHHGHVPARHGHVGDGLLRGDVRGVRPRHLPQGSARRRAQSSGGRVQDVRRALPHARHAAVRPLLGRAMRVVGRPELAEDPRFVDSAARGRTARSASRSWTRSSPSTPSRSGRSCSASRKACGHRCRRRGR